MKTAIVYVSLHHGNTKKIVEAIASKYEVTLIDGLKASNLDLSSYELIGFASGIAFSNFYPQVLKIMGNHLPENQSIFLIYTCGVKTMKYCHDARKIALQKKAKILGEYGCRGYDTYGPLRFIGGIAKGHPNDKDIKKAIEFYENLI